MGAGSAFLVMLGEVWSQVGSLVDTITAQPILLIPVGFGFAGGVVAIGKSLMGTGRRRR